MEFSSNLAQARFCSFSRLDLTSNWITYLFEIWQKISFELLFHCFANRIAFPWPLFLFCLNLFHHLSKVRSTGGDMSTNVDLSYERCSVMLSKGSMHFFSLQGKKNAVRAQEPPYLSPIKYSLDRHYDSQSLWFRRRRPNTWYLNNSWSYPLLKQ